MHVNTTWCINGRYNRVFNAMCVQTFRKIAFQTSVIYIFICMCLSGSLAIRYTETNIIYLPAHMYTRRANSLLCILRCPAMTPGRASILSSPIFCCLILQTTLTYVMPDIVHTHHPYSYFHFHSHLHRLLKPVSFLHKIIQNVSIPP